MEKVYSMQGKMGNISREMETLRKNLKESLEIKNVITKMKNTFDVLISRLTAMKRISDLKNRSVETSQTENQMK